MARFGQFLIITDVRLGFFKKIPFDRSDITWEKKLYQLFTES
jgi:hypothetical protein